MNIFSQTRNLRKNKDGSAVIEFAILAPVLVLMTIGILEFVLAFGSYIQLNEAMRQAARQAFLNNAVVDLDELTTTDAVCLKPAGEILRCGSYAVDNEESWNSIVFSATSTYPKIDDSNIIVSYTASGVGSSSTADGTVPIVSVEITGYTYNFILGDFISVSGITFPPFKTSRMKPH